MKKHSKTGVDSRYQGTILGKPAEPKAIKIEGSAMDSIEDWCRKTREKAATTKAGDTRRDNYGLSNHVDDVVESKEESDDTAMEMD